MLNSNFYLSRQECVYLFFRPFQVNNRTPSFLLNISRYIAVSTSSQSVRGHKFKYKTQDERRQAKTARECVRHQKRPKQRIQVSWRSIFRFCPPALATRIPEPMDALDSNTIEAQPKCLTKTVILIHERPIVT